jgi:hypothetical protein
LQLDLRGNGLGNDGAIILGRGLRTAESKVLAELDLGYNEIKDDGACALAQVGRGFLCVWWGGVTVDTFTAQWYFTPDKAA